VKGHSESTVQRLTAQRNAGTAILLTGEDLDVIIALSDRITVMYEGQIIGIVPPDTLVEEPGLMMTGAERARVKESLFARRADFCYHWGS
jgi:ABC-type uncharacterized transport system ATPase subunit